MEKQERIPQIFEELGGTGLLVFDQGEISQRCIDWSKFALDVSEHIEGYTVPQYGDKPNDNVESWTAEDCIKQVLKYLNRRGKSQRQGEEKLDLIKCAHYIQLAYDKIPDEHS